MDERHESIWAAKALGAALMSGLLPIAALALVGAVLG